MTQTIDGPHGQRCSSWPLEWQFQRWHVLSNLQHTQQSCGSIYRSHHVKVDYR